ncbi:hypothetical protein OF83DRAFT_1162287 [Amylostereum chailletii]|nr:hypothetical protein OF83DRAFT_1162287 [Amylostereum chailletii]
MDKFVTVTKPARGTSDPTTTTKHKSKPRNTFRYNPYEKDDRPRFTASKEKRRIEEIVAPLLKEAGGSKPSASAITKHLLGTLSDESNPITHSKSAQRAEHISSVATGHQRSDCRGSRQPYLSTRNQKLADQTAPKETNVLDNVRVYINGYLRDTTDIEMKRIVAQAGGQTLHTASGASHILTSHQLNAAKTHKLLTTKSKVKVHVVRPEWVTDSIAAGKRLSETKYSVIEDKTTNNLMSMFGRE